MNIFRDRRFSIIWTLLRIWVGYEFLTSGIEKLSSPTWVGNKAGVAITGFFKGAIAKSTGAYPEVLGWYASFIRQFAMPSAGIFTYLIPIGETLVGVSLILGLLTVVGLVGAALMNLNYLLAGAGGINTVMYTVEFLLLIAGTNAYYIGIDRFLIIPFLDRRAERDKHQ